MSTKQILNIDIILILLHFFRWAEKIIKAENISAVIVIKELSLTKNVKITVKTFGDYGSEILNSEKGGNFFIS